MVYKRSVFPISGGKKELRSILVLFFCIFHDECMKKS